MFKLWGYIAILKCSRMQCCFCLFFFGTTEAGWRPKAAAVTWHMLSEMPYFGGPWAVSFGYLSFFQLPLSMKRYWPLQDPERQNLINVQIILRKFTLHNCFPILPAAQSKVSLPTGTARPSAFVRPKLFVNKMTSDNQSLSIEPIWTGHHFGWPVDVPWF